MKRHGLTIRVKAVGKKRVNVIVQVPKPYQFALVGQLSGQRYAKLRFRREG
jgi:hypothetical protein